MAPTLTLVTMLPAQSRPAADLAQERALAAVRQLVGKVEFGHRCPGRPVVGVVVSIATGRLPR